jgi:hypothetical protein
VAGQCPCEPPSWLTDGAPGTLSADGATFTAKTLVAGNLLGKDFYKEGFDANHQSKGGIALDRTFTGDFDVLVKTVGQPNINAGVYYGPDVTASIWDTTKNTGTSGSWYACAGGNDRTTGFGSAKWCPTSSNTFANTFENLKKNQEGWLRFKRIGNKFTQEYFVRDWKENATGSFACPRKDILVVDGKPGWTSMSSGGDISTPEGSKFSDHEINSYLGRSLDQQMRVTCGACVNYIHTTNWNGAQGSPSRDCSMKRGGPFEARRYPYHSAHKGIDCGYVGNSAKRGGIIFNNNGGGCECMHGPGHNGSNRKALTLEVLDVQDYSCDSGPPPPDSEGWTGFGAGGDDAAITGQATLKDSDKVVIVLGDIGQYKDTPYPFTVESVSEDGRKCHAPPPPSPKDGDVRARRSGSEACAAWRPECPVAAVQAGKDIVPEVFWKNKWMPICGHAFWDSNNGATTICKQLGFTTGLLQALKNGKEVFDTDAQFVGNCPAGTRLDACIRDGNPAAAHDNCKAGQDVGVTIKCGSRSLEGKDGRGW